ncbi:mechanosensitive ion channel [bacterium]|nr:MAG: mechanosensitive ion channel [bacterium]
MEFLESWVSVLLTELGLSNQFTPGIRLLILLTGLILVSALFFYITKRFVIQSIYKIFKKSSMHWDDVLADHRVFDRTSHVVPAIILRLFSPIIFKDFETLLPIVNKLTDVYIIIVGVIIVISILKVTELSLEKTKLFADKPVAGYFQLIRIILYISVGILVLSILLGKSPIYFLSAFGALSAILLLVFKDTILGFVASVQMSANDMIRVGDWVEMPKFNADGDVIAINLNTVKIRNWDKTVTTVPTYYFITDSFKNWRGMQESGGRRIKRSLFVNVKTVKFVDPETRERFKKYQLITNYITKRQEEIEKHNIANQIDTSELINGRRMTNLGVFRRYIEAYLLNHKQIHSKMTLLVRQLPIEDHGIPIEIYCFTKTTAWAEYEEIQSDLFDHLLAAASFFDLEIFQSPGGSDIRYLAQHNIK